MEIHRLLFITLVVLLLVGALSLFFKKPTPSMSPPANYEFWSVIQAAGPADDRFPQRLTAVLASYSAKDVAEFREEYYRCLANSYTGQLWGAAFVIHGGCSDDGFEYFRQWLIAKGKSAYQVAMTNSDDLEVLFTPDDSGEMEGLSLAVDLAYMQKHELSNHKDLPTTQRYPEVEFEWSEDDGSLQRLYPKLWERFGQNPLVPW